MAAKLIPNPRNKTFQCDTSEDESENAEGDGNISDVESVISDKTEVDSNEYALISDDEEFTLNEEEIHIEGDRYELHCLRQSLQAEIRKYPQSSEIADKLAVNVTERNFPPSEANIENELDKTLEQLDKEEDRKSCSYCSEKKLVTDPSWLKKGQHLSVAGQKSTKYMKPLKKQIKLYSHHAIVKRVISRRFNKVKVALIHFYEKDLDGNLILSETEETFDLEFDELYIIKYDKPRYDPDEIVRRAENALQDGAKVNKEYGILMNNCEHFATWCVIGTGDSFQVGGLRSKLVNVLKTLLGAGSKITNYIMRLKIMRFLYLASDELATGVSTAAGHIVLGVTFAAYLIYCIVMTVYYVYRHRKGEICRTCLKRRLIDLWLQFGVFGVTSAITYIFIHFALPLMAPWIGVPVLVLLLVLSAVLIWLVPKIRKKFQSPLHAEGKEITSVSELSVGDVVSFSYYKLKHDLVVTEVHPDPYVVTQGVIYCVHYSLPKLTGTRIIVEEPFDVDLQKKPIKKYDLGRLNVFPANEIVRRVRIRKDETNWSLTNRSDHLCHWAMTDQSQPENNDCLETEDELGESKSRAKSSPLIEKRQIHQMEELQIGDVVEFGGNKGILVGLADLRGGRKFDLEMAIQKGRKGRIRVNKETIDLNTDTVTVHLYHPAHCYPMQERNDRALGMRDKSTYCWTQSGFIDECVLIPHTYRKKPVHDISGLHGGEMVYSTYSIQHYSIVTEVRLERETVKTKGRLKCANYSSSRDTRIVAEDWYEIDLEKDKLTLIEFGRTPTFSPQEIIRRVRRRIDETKWNKANRSDHLCFWAALDERRAETQENTEAESADKSEKRGSLRCLETREVHLMEEVQLGDVIYLYGKSSIRNRGILVELRDIRDGREFEMDIVMLKDRPRLEQVRVDLNKDKVFVRLYKSSDCYPMEERARRANEMRDRPCERWTQSGYIKDCIMKNN